MFALKRKRLRAFPAPVTIHGYQTVTSEEISIALDTLNTRVAVGRDLTKSNSLPDSALQKRNLTDYSV